MDKKLKEKLFKRIEKKLENGNGWLQGGVYYKGSLDDVEEAVKLYSKEIQTIQYRRTPKTIKVWK